MKNEIKFSDYREKIQESLSKKLKENPIKGEDGFALIEGFITLPIMPSLHGADWIASGGNALLVVSIVCNTSGRIYYFSLKALLPDLDLSR